MSDSNPVETLLELLTKHIENCGEELRKKEQEKRICFYGSKAVMQGKQQVDGHYFAELVPKPKDLRLYFFPIYTHPEKFPALSVGLQKCLKGKSCFHLKNLNNEVIEEVKVMINTGYKTYKEANLI